MDVDVTSLTVFLSVVELGSVSKAAARHGMSQPSATARLAKLETSLGVTLLERTPTGSRPTAEGRQVAALAGEVVAASQHLVDGARELRSAGRPVLTVAATSTIATRRLPAWVAGADLGDVELRLVEADTRSIAGLVRDGEATVGLMAGPNAPVGLRSELVAAEPLVVVVAPGHPWAGRRRPIRATDVATTSLLLRNRGSGTHDVIEEALRPHGFVPTAGHRSFASNAGIRLAIVNSDGVGIIPEVSAADDLDAGRLVAVPVDLALDQPIRVVWRDGPLPSPHLARFLREIRARAGGESS
ncbi:MAG: LysR family transcriptional regulator [Acidimicrobiales bacterium]